MDVNLITTLAVFVSAISLAISSFVLGKNFGMHYDDADKKADKVDEEEAERSRKIKTFGAFRDGVDHRVGVERANMREEDADD